MSWMKRRGHTTTPSPGNAPTSQIYAGNQHSQENQWQQSDLSANNWFNQTAQNQQKQQYQYNPQDQTNYWPQQQQQQSQLPPQTQYNPQNQQPPTNQYQQIYHQHNVQQQQQQQQLQQHQNYYTPVENPTLNDQYNQQTQRYNYNRSENNPYSMQQSQTPEQDSWGNWGWGDEDNSNVQTSHNINANTNQVNNIAESFATEDTWNWSVDESSSSTSTLNYPKPDNSTGTTSLTSLDSFKLPQDVAGAELFPKMGKLADKHNNVVDNSDAVQINKNIEPSKIPGVNKLRNSEHLTPQWSTESQMSQESSDDILQTSESDKMLSRSSTISQSPISGHDGLVDNLIQTPEMQQQILQNIKQENLLEEDQKPYLPTPQLNQYENVEILSNIKQEPTQSYLISPGSQNIPLKSSPPPPPVHNLTPPPPGQITKAHTPPPPMKNQTPPLLTSQGSSDDLKNPYKRTTMLSHNAANKSRVLNLGSGVERPQPSGFQPFNQLVNLETLPDNSEQPDSLVPMHNNQGVKKGVVTLNAGHQIPPQTQHIPDNNEVAPINERNQYLETGQLSDESTNQLQIENVDACPPPGLRRMVLGQIESSDSNLNATVDEPPPGLSRMVLGQTESSSSLTNVTNTRDSNGPPVGFLRMVPGESSSPESTSRHQYQVYQEDNRHEEYNSEVELNQLHAGAVPQTRSATIGADTPPTIANPVITQSNMNRSETIGSDLKLSDSRSIGSDQVRSENRVGALGVDRDDNEDNLRGNENRRDSIEGQPQESDLNDLVSGVRDMTVSADIGTSNNELEQNSRGRSRQESTDSEREVDRSKSPRDHRDTRRYRDKDDRRDKNRSSRYSPDSYRDSRDKRYDRRRPTRDRRYDDDTDYFSDKDKEARRDDYDKRYGTSRSNKDKDRDRRKRDVRDRRDDRRDEYDRRDRDRDYHRMDYDRRDPRNRGDYYYGHYGENYDAERSRPSSRSDSMHDSYRDRHERDSRRQRPRDRERDPRRHRDFNPYMQSYSYDPYNPYYQQYQYYENLRRTNPQAYAEWYRKYYQQAGLSTSAANFGTEDRGSVHSGRSSANEEIKESYGRPYDTTESVNLDDTSTQAQRLTPAKFATAHIKASISSGKLIKILPHYPMDGQNAVVELVSIQNLLSNDDEIEELAGFPGPLIRGITHKKTVIEYCENKIRNAGYSETITDPSSYILLWELMILLIRQNGMVVGTDIAELLMKDRSPESSVRPSSVISNASSAIVEANTSEASNLPSIDGVNTSSISVLKEEVVTNKFREYLIYGSGKEALEWAMKHGLWGHALFLASKLDKRTYANVMMRFANGLTLNDPLQTLYQLLSGRIPSAVTAVADEKWGDWRPHLAMILSNTTPRPELDRKAITTLADTLMSRGSVYAAQFCYLMAEVGFGRYGTENSKLVLLGSNHNKPFVQFATNEAIHLTEIYEYACSLNDAGFLILEFQPYKYLIASRLSDRGLLEKSLAYLERISLAIVQNPTAMQPSLIDRVLNLADKLKYNDPVVDGDESTVVESELDISRPDNTWLKDLKLIQNDYSMGLISHQSENNLLEPSVEYDGLQQPQVGYDNTTQDSWQNQHQNMDQYQSGNYAQWQGEQLRDQVSGVDQHLQEQQEGYVSQYQDQQQLQQQQYWSQQNQQSWGATTTGDIQQSHLNYPGGQTLQDTQLETAQSSSQQNEYWNNAQNEDPMAINRPQISMPNQMKRQASIDSDDTSTPNEKTPKPSPVKPKSMQKNEKPTSNSGWFGGIFSRMAFRPKNQMKLPDDKNPSIVWDQDKKKWINLDEDGAEVNSEMKPPPKLSDMMPKLQTDSSGPPSQPPGNLQQFGAISANTPMQAPGSVTAVPATADEAPKSLQPNMFKLQRGRNLKKSYVDVFNPSGKSSDNNQSVVQNNMFLAGAATQPANNSSLNFFIPAPVNDPNAPMDFLTPGTVNTDAANQAYQQPQ